MPRRHHLAAALALAFACDPGFNIHAVVEVSAEIAAKYTKDQRGLLMVTISPDRYGSETAGLHVICGEAVTSDFGTGDLGGLPDTVVTAWIEPLPADDARPCGPVDNYLLDIADFSLDEDDPQAREDIAGAGGCDSNTADVTLAIAVPN